MSNMKARRQKYDVLPLVGLGPGKFGMSRAEIARAFDTLELRETRQGIRYDRVLLPERELFVDFDHQDAAWAFEVGRGGPQLIWKGEDLLKMQIHRLIDSFKSEGHSVEETDSGFVCASLGVACYSQDAATGPRWLRLLPEALMCFREGYFREQE